MLTQFNRILIPEIIKGDAPQRIQVNTALQCADVSTSGYNDWLDRPESQRSLENKALTIKIRHSHEQSGEVYGSPKIHKDLIADGETCSENRVARLMNGAEIKSIMARKFVVTTDSKNTLQPAPDLLQRNFSVGHQDKAWVSDTTFIATREGWLYLAIILDLFSRQVVGWSMSTRNDAVLVQDALTNQLTTSLPVLACIFTLAPIFINRC